MNWPTQIDEFQLGDFPLQSGEVLRDAKLVWKSYGTLNEARDNVIL
jgi:homoserine O-acetyltransferase